MVRRILSNTPAAIRKRLARAAETQDQANQRRESDRLRAQWRRANASAQKTSQQREADRLRVGLGRATATEQQTAQRRQGDRSRHETRATQRLARLNLTRNLNDLPVLIEDTVEEFYCGPMNFRCEYCQSKNFKGEMAADKKFTNCCEKGKIQLRPLRTHDFITTLMKGEHAQSKNFMENIRCYNSALAFASMGAQVVPPPGNGPYCYRIHGQIYHLTGPLHPRQGDEPQYSQLYILDAAEAVNARIGQRANNGCFPPLMNELGILMQNVNPFAEAYKMMREFEIQEQELALQEGLIRLQCQLLMTFPMTRGGITLPNVIKSL